MGEKKLKTFNDAIQALKSDYVEEGIFYKNLSSKVSGKNIWTLWSSIKDDEVSFNFIQLYYIYLEDGEYKYTSKSYEIEFEKYDCPKFFIEKTLDSPFRDEAWRQGVMDWHDTRDIKGWEDCKKLFHKLSVNDTGKIRVYLKGMFVKNTTREVPYADLVSIYPFVGRYNGCLYEIRKYAIQRIEVITTSPPPRGLEKKKQRKLQKLKKEMRKT